MGTDVAATNMNRVVRQLCSLALWQEFAGMSDAQLLESFLAYGDEAAFEALVRRHGPMVLSVCRRVLHDHHDAEDCFQAVFLVLIRKAGSIGKRELLGNWLYGVASRTAMQLRKATAKRVAKERQVWEMTQTKDETVQEMLPLLDQELGRLPDKYRVPIILCDLEGRTRREAARQLDVPERTLSTRLARARVMLAKRLSRHGISLSGVAVATAASQSVASAMVSTWLLTATVEAGTCLAAGNTALISAKVVALTERMVKTMLLTTLKNTTAFVLAFFLAVGVGAGLMSHGIRAGEQQDEKKAEPQKEPKPAERAAATGQAELHQVVESVAWVLTNVDAKHNTIQVRELTVMEHWLHNEMPHAPLLNLDGSIHDDRIQESPWVTRLALEDFAVDKKAKVFIDGKEARFSDLTAKMHLSLKLLAGRPIIARIEATSPSSSTTTILKSVDAEKRTVTVVYGGKVLTLPLATDAKIIYNYKRETDSLADLKLGGCVSLNLVMDKERFVVKRLFGDHKDKEIKGKIKSIDADKGIIMVIWKGQDKTFPVPASAAIQNHDGNPLKEGLKDKRLQEGTEVTIYWDKEDGKKFATQIRLVEGKK